MKEFIEHIIHHLVDNPKAVHVDQVIGEQTIVLDLHVEPSDMGKVIGRNGQMADALRTILAVASARRDKKYILEIIKAQQEGMF